jgi:hypothetical protein
MKRQGLKWAFPKSLSSFRKIKVQIYFMPFEAPEKLVPSKYYAGLACILKREAS